MQKKSCPLILKEKKNIQFLVVIFSKIMHAKIVVIHSTNLPYKQQNFKKNAIIYREFHLKKYNFTMLQFSKTPCLVQTSFTLALHIKIS